MAPTDLTLALASTHVLVTGGAGQIGRFIVSAFLSAGSKVTVFDVSRTAISALEESVAEDIKANLYPAQYSPVHLWCDVADISSEASLSAAWAKAEAVFGPVACCVALASLDLSVLEHHAGGIADMSIEQWERTMRVNVTGTFLTAREWVRRLRAHQESVNGGERGGSAVDRLQSLYLPNRSLIIVGSESGLFGERTNPDYAAGKSAVQGGLLASLKADIPKVLGPGARVNAIAPGPVNTEVFREECERDPGQFYADARGTVALGRPVDVGSVARSTVYLASERWSGSVHGTVLRVDSGKEGKLMWKDGE